jgi:hypothetical protein
VTDCYIPLQFEAPAQQREAAAPAPSWKQSISANTKLKLKTTIFIKKLINALCDRNQNLLELEFGRFCGVLCLLPNWQTRNLIA